MASSMESSSKGLRECLTPAVSTPVRVLLMRGFILSYKSAYYTRKMGSRVKIAEFQQSNDYLERDVLELAPSRERSS
jgi:hypothetical protein